MALNSTVEGSIFVYQKAPSYLSELYDVKFGVPIPDGYYLRSYDGYWDKFYFDEDVINIIGSTDLNSITAIDGYFDQLTFGDDINLNNVYDILNEPSGFPNVTDSTISVNDGTLTFSIAPVSSSFDFYIKGKKFTKTSTDSVVWTNVEGIHFFYYNTSGILVHTMSESDWVVALQGSGALVAAIYWSTASSSAIYFAEERHGFMDPRVHSYLHSAFGSQWMDGGQLTNILADQNGSLNSHAQFGVSTVTVADEDLRFTYTDGNPQEMDPIAYIPIYYRYGSGQDWRLKTADTFPIVQSGTAGYTGANSLPAYNQYTGGSWTLTQVSHNNFFLMHYYIGNDKTYPVFGVLGEVEYSTLGAAQTGALTEINQIGAVLRSLSKEFAPLGTVIFAVSTTYTNSVKARIVSTEEGEDYIDFRGNALTGGGASSGGVTDHGNLTGLADDDHTQYLLIDGTRAMSGSLSLGDHTISDVDRILIQNLTGNVLVGEGISTSLIGSNNTILGYNTGANLTDGNSNTLIGLSGSAITDGYLNTAVGYNAYITGNYFNCTALGANSEVTGSNQVQLGDSDTTVYYYAISARSDERDKTDIRNETLGLDFINQLRPVEFKWDYREDYTGIKDGSKKRKRFHHGLIAQEVKQVCDNLGIDFAGYQDGIINGGKDIKSLSYVELISVLIKGIQELSSDNEKLKITVQNLADRVKFFEEK